MPFTYSHLSPQFYKKLTKRELQSVKINYYTYCRFWVLRNFIYVSIQLMNLVSYIFWFCYVKGKKITGLYVFPSTVVTFQQIGRYT